MICFFLIVSVTFANSNDVATIKEVKGEVVVTRSGGKVEYNIKEGIHLFQGDSIRVGKNF